MFEIGFWELILVGVVTLLVVGPEQLPEVARTAGRWFGQLSRMLDNVRAEVDRELHLEELKASFRQQALQDELQGVKKDLDSLSSDFAKDTADVQESIEDAEYEATLPMPPARMRPTVSVDKDA